MVYTLLPKIINLIAMSRQELMQSYMVCGGISGNKSCSELHYKYMINKHLFNSTFQFKINSLFLLIWMIYNWRTSKYEHLYCFCSSQCHTYCSVRFCSEDLSSLKYSNVVLILLTILDISQTLVPIWLIGWTALFRTMSWPPCPWLI